MQGAGEKRGEERMSIWHHITRVPISDKKRPRYFHLNPWPKRPMMTAAHLVSLWQEVSLQLDKLHIQQFIFGMKHKHMGQVNRGEGGIITYTAPQAYKNPYPNLPGLRKQEASHHKLQCWAQKLPIPPGVQGFREMKHSKAAIPKIESVLSTIFSLAVLLIQQLSLGWRWYSITRNCIKSGWNWDRSWH